MEVIDILTTGYGISGATGIVMVLIIYIYSGKIKGVEERLTKLEDKFTNLEMRIMDMLSKLEIENAKIQKDIEWIKNKLK